MSGKRTRSGFTLVELLVIFGIIAVLISVLMPALCKARMAAQRVQCMSNLRQVGLAVQLHMNASKGFFLPGTIKVAGDRTTFWLKATSAEQGEMDFKRLRLVSAK